MTGAVCAVMRNRFASRVSQTIGKELRRDMYHNVQLLSMENIDRLRPASIITRITNDVVQVQEFISGRMRIMVKAPITCIGAIILILVQTPRQAPVMAGILVVVSVLILGNMRIGYPRFGTVQKRLDQLNGVTREFLSSVRVAKAFHAEEKEGEKFEDVSLAFARANMAALRTIARAVFANAPILILDEATSSVNTVTEQKIRRALLKICKDRTSVIIAHRLSTIRDSDMIILLDNGKIAEQGTHGELMALDGIYARMYRTQTEFG